MAVKSVAQQDIQATHRIRSELMTQRTAKANQIRGLVAECGLVAPLTLWAATFRVPQRNLSMAHGVYQIGEV